MVSDLYLSALHERRTAQARQTTRVALFIAAILHYPLLHAAFLVAQISPATSQGDYDPWDITEVSLIDGLDLSEEMTAEELAEAEEKRKELLREEEENLDGRQVVTLPPQPDTRRPPEPTKYLAKHDSRTDKETKKTGNPDALADGPSRPSVAAGQGNDVAAPSDALLAPIVPPEALAMVQPEAVEPPAAEVPERRSTRLLKLLEEGESELKISPEILKAVGRAGQPGDPVNPYEALLPPLASGGGGGGMGDFGTDDHLPEVEDGDETVLNARRFKYWGFFQRVKESLKRNWRPAREYRRADPTGRVYGVRDRMTVLSVRLDRDGGLMDLSLRAGSGVAPLDDEAMRAFRAAQPFPNPPAGLVAEDGTIEFTFGLFLDIRNRWEFRPLRLPAFR
jgi:TonB family protein